MPAGFVAARVGSWRLMSAGMAIAAMGAALLLIGTGLAGTQRRSGSTTQLHVG